VFFQSTTPVGYGKWELFSSGSGSGKIGEQFDNIFMTARSRKFLECAEEIPKRKEKEKAVKAINFHVTARKCAQFSTCSLIIEA